MAIRNIADLKSWFKKGLYPTESQFADWIDSYWHKEDDMIPIDAVDGLKNAIDDKFPNESGEALKTITLKTQEDLAANQEYNNYAFSRINDNLDALETTDEEIKAEIVELHQTDENLQEGLNAAYADITLIRDTLKNGATLSQAKEALIALGSNYKDVYAVANTLKTFLEASDTMDSSINTWREIEKFLQSITDTSSLTAILEQLENRIKDYATTKDSELKSNILSEISAENGMINLAVSKGISELQFEGTRNLLLNSAVIGTKAIISVAPRSMAPMWVQMPALVSGTWYMISFTAREVNNNTADLHVELNGSHGGNVQITGSAWKRYGVLSKFDGMPYVYVWCTAEGQSFECKDFHISSGSKIVDWSPAPEDITSEIEQAKTEAIADAIAKIDNIQVGGRNYALDSKLKQRLYPGFITYYLSEDIIDKEVSLTVSFTVDVAETQGGGIGWGNGASCNDFFSFPIIEVGSKTYTVTSIKPRGLNTLMIYFNQLTEVTVTNLSVQTGNKFVDWSPAPEDYLVGNYPGGEIADGSITNEKMKWPGDGQSNIALGTEAMVDDGYQYSIALGYKARINDQYAIAIGTNSGVDQNNSIAIGNRAGSSGPWSISLGYQSYTGESNCIAIGKQACADGNDSAIAIGCAAQANAESSISIGEFAKATNQCATALGYYANAAGTDSLALGNCAKAAGETSVAIGYNVSATADSCVAIGNNANATGYKCVALGNNAEASGEGDPGGGGVKGLSTAIGGSAKAQARGTACGYASQSTGYFSAALGMSAGAIGQGSVALGAYAGVSSLDSTAVGYGAWARSDFSTTLGTNSYVEGKYSTVVGAGANTKTDRTMQLGILGDNSLQKLSCPVSLTVTSDANDKADIKSTDEELAKKIILGLRPVDYVINHRARYLNDVEVTRKGVRRVDKEVQNEDGTTTITPVEEEYEYTETQKARLYDEDGNISNYDREAHTAATKKASRVNAGFVAQEVQALLDDLTGSDKYGAIVSDNSRTDDKITLEGREMGLAYEKFIPLMVSTIQSLNKEVEELKAQLQTVIKA